MSTALTPAVRDKLSAHLEPARLSQGVLLAPFTTFRVGGPADFLYVATSADDLATAVTTARVAGVPWFVLGLGANVLIGDRGFRGVVIRNCATSWQVDSHGLLRAESGAVVGDIIPRVVEEGWSGLEHYVGIPSTIGGAIWQNLHFLSPAPARDRTCYIAEVFEDADVLMEDGGRRTFTHDDMHFGYDDSVLHHHRHVALSARFQLAPGDRAAMHRIMQENLSWRGARHPWLGIHPSAGSIFKKITGVGAGRLIDECGLKGYRVGNAMISHVHANIIINLGGARAADIRAIIDHAQRVVADSCGQVLVPEIAFVGEF